jgi:hypothetical protein
MMAKSHVSLWVRLTLFVIVCALAALPATAQVAKQGNDVLSSLAFVHEKLQAPDDIEPIANVRAVTDKALQNGWEAYKIGVGPNAEWNASIDKRTGLVTFAEGGNVAWIPGRGNQLSTKGLGGFLKSKPQIDLEVMDAIARDYMPRVKSFLGIDPSQLALDRGRSGQPAGHVWFVDYNVVREGLPIEGARVVFRVNNGNLIQYGSENLPAPGATVPPTRLTKKQALDAVAKYIGGFQVGDTFRDNGSLHLLPSAIPSKKFAEGYEFGKGRGIAKVWQFTFHRDGVMGTWRARVDAASGEVLELTDVNDYVSAPATGGIYQNSPTTGAEIVRPMPFLTAGSTTTNSGGIYNFTTAVTTNLSGTYVRLDLPGVGRLGQHRLRHLDRHQLHDAGPRRRGQHALLPRAVLPGQPDQGSGARLAAQQHLDQPAAHRQRQPEPDLQRLLERLDAELLQVGRRLQQHR